MKPEAQTREWTMAIVEAVRAGVNADGSFSTGPMQDVVDRAINAGAAWMKSRAVTVARSLAGKDEHDLAHIIADLIQDCDREGL